MTIVLFPGQSVSDLVGLANQSCPDCGGPLRRWGHARWRVVRDPTGDWRHQPARVRCGRCGVSQVVLPAEVLVRRRDAVAVTGRAWRLFAAGAGSRRAAKLLGLPVGTVRAWLRRLRAGARAREGPAASSDVGELGRALAFVESEARRAGWGAEPGLWRFVAWRSEGCLLSNTSWPWLTP
jgi:ribosomal protein S27AE